MTTQADRRRAVEASDDPRYEPIVAAAVEIISRAGHRSLVAAEVAWRSGVTAAGVIELFPSTQDLLVAVLEWRDMQDVVAVREAFADDDDADARAVLRNLVERNASQPRLVELYAHLATLSLDPTHPAHAYFDRRYREAIEILADIVGRLTSQPEAVARQIIAVMDGLQLQWLRDPDRFDLVAEWDAVAARLLPAEPARDAAASPLRLAEDEPA